MFKERLFFQLVHLKKEKRDGGKSKEESGGLKKYKMKEKEMSGQ